MLAEARGWGLSERVGSVTDRDTDGAEGSKSPDGLPTTRRHSLDEGLPRPPTRAG